MTTATTTDWRERHAHDLMASYAPPLRMLVRGEGCWVWDDEGTQLPRLPRRHRGQLARARPPRGGGGSRARRRR